MNACKKFEPNFFNSSKCQNCFRTKCSHTFDTIDYNRSASKIAKCGYLFVAPECDLSLSINRHKRWQRRWFTLFTDGQLNYSLDEHPDTLPQGCIDMSKIVRIFDADLICGHPYSIGIQSTDRTYFIKASRNEERRWWFDMLSQFTKQSLTTKDARLMTSVTTIKATPNSKYNNNNNCTTNNSNNMNAINKERQTPLTMQMSSTTMKPTITQATLIRKSAINITDEQLESAQKELTLSLQKHLDICDNRHKKIDEMVKLNEVKNFIESDHLVERKSDTNNNSKFILNNNTTTISKGSEEKSGNTEKYAGKLSILHMENKRYKEKLNNAYNQLRELNCQLRESYENYDCLELSYKRLKSQIDVLEIVHESEINLLKQKVNDLTKKLTQSEKIIRLTKQRSSSSSSSVSSKSSSSLNLATSKSTIIPGTLAANLTAVGGGGITSTPTLSACICAGAVRRASRPK